MVHRNFRVSFELDGQWFEAVGFLNDGEKFVSAQEALRRCDNGFLIKEGEDINFIFNYRQQLPRKQLEHTLLTGVQAPNFPQGYVMTIVKQMPPFNVPANMNTWNRWSMHWYGPIHWNAANGYFGVCNSTVLVVRRVKGS